MRRLRAALAFTLLFCLALIGGVALHTGLAIDLTADTDPDKYKGDTAIYSGSSTEPLPVNVMFLIDTSRNMGQSGTSEPYDPAKTYSGPYEGNTIYLQLNASSFQSYVPADADGTLSDGLCADAVEPLTRYGFFNKGLKKATGDCSNKSGDVGNYYMGNLLNKIQSTPSTPVWEAGKAYTAGQIIKPSDTGSDKTYICVQAGISGAGEPTWPTGVSETVSDGTAKWEMMAPLIDIVKSSIGQVVGAFKDRLRVGFMTVGSNNAGGWVRAEVKPMSDATNYTNFMSTLSGITYISSNTSMPMNEALHDSFYYYKGENTSNSKMSSDTAPYLSPIQYACQGNLVIVLTTGSSTPSPQAEGKIGDKNRDGMAGRIDDAAKMLYETDVLPDQAGVEKTLGTQRIRTSVIQLMTSKVQELETATNSGHGRGKYAQVSSSEQLIKELFDMLGNFVRESETAFVAPVVPASPENRTYSGKRIYVGFFKPISNQAWWGNLKKFGIDAQNRIVGSDGTTLATNDDGTFNPTVTSFWSTGGDAGKVEKGGVGGKLKDRSTARKIYTYTGTADKNLTSAANLFSEGNSATALSAANLRVPEADRSKLIKYIHGIDGYNDNGNGDTVKREWLLGDILHSKPLIVNYKRYSFSVANEADPNLNKTYIFMGGNDGMLHCFRDVDGEEEWAFIPPDMLPRLRHMRSGAHHYYVDSTPAIYIHDAGGDGNIVKADGDSAVLVFGVRRGEGMSSLTDAGSRGSYYAVDVTDPTAPVFLWQINNKSAGFGEMAETWSQPRLARVKIGSERKIVAFVGAGYDNVEDLRFGSTQTYPPGATAVTLTDEFTTGKSDDGGDPLSPRGRGVYAIEIATLVESGENATPVAPDFDNTGQLIWGFTYGAPGFSNNIRTSPEMTFSIPSDILALDRNHDGFIDRLYVGDVGGNLWRFNVGDGSVSNWNAKKIFQSNPGADGTNGRKIFYKPDVTIADNANVMVYFGTGDREHPQNYKDPGGAGAVVDRLYAVRDSDSHATVLTEDNLHDVTENKLQQDLSADAINTEKSALSSSFGWYIRLDSRAGEKVLAAASVFNKVAFYTTYQPDTVEKVALQTNPCFPGNPGTSRLYAVSSQTGEAAYNFATSGTDFYGESQSSATNERSLARDKDGNSFVLRRADREKTLGGGIPSGMVFIIGADGAVSTLTSADASFPALELEGNGMIYPIYWMQW